MIDAVHRDTIDRHRFEREAGDATLHGLTYSVADWRASEKCAVPQERFLYPSTPTQPVRASGFDSAVRQGTAQLRPYSTVPSARLQRLSLPEKETATRASKLLNSMTQDDWANFTKHGAPEAWQVARKGTKKGNTNLRRELAHISRLRDVHRRSGAMSVTPSFFSYDAASSPTRGMARYASGGMPGADGVEGPRTQAAAVKDLRGAPVEADRSRSATPAGMPLRPVTSMSITLQQAGPSSGRESPALTPNTIRRQHLTELMGTDSRPTSVYKVLKRRQPQAEFHMLWSVGPKRFDSYRQNAENELLAEKKADQAKRRLLIKQVYRVCSPSPPASLRVDKRIPRA